MANENGPQKPNNDDKPKPDTSVEQVKLILIENTTGTVQEFEIPIPRKNPADKQDFALYYMEPGINHVPEEYLKNSGIDSYLKSGKYLNRGEYKPTEGK